VSGVRPPAAAGTFYPDDPERLAGAVDRLLSEAGPAAERRPWGLVVPHAGYRYSGPVAATAYAAIRPWAEAIGRVALLGPAHFVPVHGCAVTSATAWRTPIGDVPVDDELRDAAVAAGAVVDDLAHAPEHALEVQLPFLRRLLGPGLRILPVAVGATAEAASAVLDAAVGSIADLVVVSTDLSHYHDVDNARALDRRTADAIVAADPNGIGQEDACGRDALRAALAYAGRAGMRVGLLDLRTSADTSGDPERVVGYGAFSITPTA
jgi:AmmeMemoRadiSam system protein B